MPPASAPPRLYPLFADLRGRPVLVVGGGAVALRKAEALLAAGASVSVGAPRLVSGLQALAAESRVVHVAGRFQPRWLDPMFLVVAARSEEHTSELQSLMRIHNAVFCLKKINSHDSICVTLQQLVYIQ